MTEACDVPITMGIVPIWLYHKNNPNTRISVYALLDNASGRTFVKEDSLRKLGMEEIESKLLFTTMHGTQEIETNAVDGLMASYFENIDPSLALPRTYVSQQIPADRLIGLNCAPAVRPRDVICRNENDPYTVRSLLGWYVNGPVRHNSSKQVH